MTRKIWPLLSLFLLLSGCGSIDWFPSVTNTSTTTPTTFTVPTITAAISPTSITSGGTSALTLTINNKTGNPAQTELQFQEQLPTGVTATNAVSNCGGTVETTSSFIIFTKGALASGATSCTITATLGATITGTTSQSFVIKSADFSGFGTSGLVSGVTDQTLTVSPVAAAVLFPTLTAAVVPVAILDGASSTLSFTITNATGNPAQSLMGFTETLPTGFKATVATASQCGGTLSSSGSNLGFAGGALAAGSASCTLSAELSLTTSNTITADQTSSVKNADFSGLQGNLVNGVTDQAFKVFPSALTVASAGVTVSNLIAVGTADSTKTKFNFAFTTDTSNTSASAVNATVTVVGIDANGAQIASTLAPLSVSIPTNSGGVKTPSVDLNSTNPLAVSNADSANVSFWRLLTVTVP